MANKNTFENFKEASDFAKSLAKNGVRHNIKHEGMLWVVYHDSTIISDTESRELEECRAAILDRDYKLAALKREFEAKEQQFHVHIKNLKAENASLQKKAENVLLQNGLLRDSIEDEISERLADERKALDNLKDGASKEREKLQEEVVKLNCKMHRLSLLEKAYSEKFGEAEVITVKEKVNSNRVCPRCGGDGGVQGGCQKCDGKGWVESTETQTREVVKLV